MHVRFQLAIQLTAMHMLVWSSVCAAGRAVWTGAEFRFQLTLMSCGGDAGSQPCVQQRQDIRHAPAAHIMLM